MITELGTQVATRSRATGRRNRLRLAEYDRLRDGGMGRIEAWRKVRTDPEIGFAWAHPNDTEGCVLDGLAKFLNRVAPERIVRARADLADTVPDAVGAIGDIIRGDFGEGKVIVKGRGENAEEFVVIDAAAAGVRSQNARWLLERTGVVAPANASGVTVNGPAQFNFASAAKTRAASG